MQLAEISAKLKSESASTSAQSNSVADATRDVSATMHSVAACMEETSTNINLVTASSDELFKNNDEIAQSSGRTQTVIDSAAATFADVSAVIRELGNAAKEIDAVTDSIRGVCEQVNLLAFNATIEAARAGEAGKGFAVVAQEIKELAQASDQVSETVRSVDASTQQILSSSDLLNQWAAELSDFSAKIKAATHRFKV